VDTGDLRADSLQDVSSKDEMSDDPQEAVWFQGALKIRRSMTKVSLPSDSESLRRRVRILGVTFDLAKAKNPSRAWLRTCSKEVWADHLDYILGDTVFGFDIKAAGRSIRPPWDLILSYEQEIRKEAIRLVLYEGSDLASAMHAARHGTEHRERFFVTPCMCSMVAAAAATPAPNRGKGGQKGHPGDNGDYVISPGAGPYGGKPGKDRRKGKGKGKGSKAKVPDGKATHTPDGQQICFAFNSITGCSGGCGRVHCCRSCFGKHTLLEHPGSAAGK
jgi:hypothetical protein